MTEARTLAVNSMKTTLALALLLAGCLAPATPAANHVNIDVSAGGLGTKIQLLAGNETHDFETTQDDYGAWSDTAYFQIAPTAPCTILVTQPDWQTYASVRDCRHSFHLNVTLLARPKTTPPATRDFRVPLGTKTSIIRVLVESNGTAVANAEVSLDGVVHQVTNRSGVVAFATNQGLHKLRIQAPCWTTAEFLLKASEARALDVELAVPNARPSPPESLQATPGPGPGMMTLTWKDVTNATAFDLYRNGQPILHLGHSFAYTLPKSTALDQFTVRSVDACGRAGNPTPMVSGKPLPGTDVAATPIPAELHVSKSSYAAYDANGKSVVNHSWRIVDGRTTTIATNAAGQLVAASDAIRLSDSEGLAWFTLPAPVPLASESAVAAAPDCDLVAVTSTPEGQGVAYHYWSATNQWAMAPISLPPGFQDPTLGVLKGPFRPGDLVAPFATILQGTTGLLLSLDGLHYAPTTLLPHIGTYTFGGLKFPADANRDWLGAPASFALSLDNGVGVLDPSEGLGALASKSALRDNLTWSAVQMPQIPGSVLRSDSTGNLHALDWGASHGFTYSWSRDGGETWSEARVPVPGAIQHADLRVNYVQDQAVVGVEVQQGDGRDVFRIYRFAGLDGDVHLQQVLDVGLGDLTQPVGLGPLTLSILPSGHIAMSFRDSKHPTSAIAIEAP
jgi:hypothetical protein